MQWRSVRIIQEVVFISNSNSEVMENTTEICDL